MVFCHVVPLSHDSCFVEFSSLPARMGCYVIAVRCFVPNGRQIDSKNLLITVLRCLSAYSRCSVWNSVLIYKYRPNGRYSCPGRRYLSTSSNYLLSSTQFGYQLMSLVVVPLCAQGQFSGGHLPEIAVGGGCTSLAACSGNTHSRP